METDRSETKDLAKKYPDRVKELAAMWQQYAERDIVFPCPHAEFFKSLDFRVIISGPVVVSGSDNHPVSDDDGTHSRIRRGSSDPLPGQTKGLSHEFLVFLIQT